MLLRDGFEVSALWAGATRGIGWRLALAGLLLALMWAPARVGAQADAAWGRAVLWLPIDPALRGRIHGQLADLDWGVVTAPGGRRPRSPAGANRHCRARAADVVWWVTGSAAGPLQLHLFRCARQRLLRRAFAPAGPRVADRSANLEAVALALRAALRAIAEGLDDPLGAVAGVAVPGSPPAGFEGGPPGSRQEEPGDVEPPPEAEVRGAAREAAGRRVEPGEAAPARAPRADAPRPSPSAPPDGEREGPAGDADEVWPSPRCGLSIGPGIAVDGQSQSGAIALWARADLHVAPWWSVGIEGTLGLPSRVDLGDTRLILRRDGLFAGSAVTPLRVGPVRLWLRLSGGVLLIRRSTEQAAAGLLESPAQTHPLPALSTWGGLSYGLGSQAALSLSLGALWLPEPLLLRAEATDGGVGDRARLLPVQPGLRLALEVFIP